MGTPANSCLSEFKVVRAASDRSGSAVGGGGQAGEESGRSEHQGLDKHHGLSVAGKHGWGSSTRVQPHGDGIAEVRPEDVGHEDHPGSDSRGVGEQHAHIPMDPSVGEQDDHVVGADAEEFVGMVGTGMAKGSGWQAVSPAQERRVLGQTRRRSRP